MRFIDGFRCITDGFSLLRSTGAGALVWLPPVMSLVIVGSGIGWTLKQSGAIESWLIAQLPHWLAFLGTLLAWLVNLIVIVAGLWLFGFLAMVLSSPLHGTLSARFDRKLSGKDETINLSVGRMLASAVRRELRKLRYQLPRMLGVALISFVPLVNVIAPVAGILMTGWLMAIQFADLPGENRDQSFDRTIAKLRENRGAALGFGSGVALLLSIPIVNVFVIPVAIAGGTLLWHRLEQEAAGLNSV